MFQGLTNIALNGIVLGVIYAGGYLVSSNEINPGMKTLLNLYGLDAFIKSRLLFVQSGA